MTLYVSLPPRPSGFIWADIVAAEPASVIVSVHASVSVVGRLPALCSLLIGVDDLRDIHDGSLC